MAYVKVKRPEIRVKRFPTGFSRRPFHPESLSAGAAALEIVKVA